MLNSSEIKGAFFVYEDVPQHEESVRLTVTGMSFVF